MVVRDEVLERNRCECVTAYGGARAGTDYNAIDCFRRARKVDTR